MFSNLMIILSALSLSFCSAHKSNEEEARLNPAWRGHVDSSDYKKVKKYEGWTQNPAVTYFVPVCEDCKIASKESKVVLENEELNKLDFDHVFILIQHEGKGCKHRTGIFEGPVKHSRNLPNAIQIEFSYEAESKEAYNKQKQKEGCKGINSYIAFSMFKKDQIVANINFPYYIE